MTETFICRFCGGERPHNGSICLGCGSQMKHAVDNASRPKRSVRCPKCYSGSYRPHPDGSMICQECSAWYSPDEDGISAVDDRPEVNAMKMEELRKKEMKSRARHYRRRKR